MAPRRAAPSSPQSISSTRSTRSSRSNTTAEPPQEKKPPLSQRRPLKSSMSTKKSVTTRVTRASQANGQDEEEASESGTDADKEDDNNDEDDADEPAVEAPSGIVTRKRRHQTGLSLTLSNTTLNSLSRGTKRELSTSTVDGAEVRPRKQQKQKPLVEEDDSSDDDVYNAVNDISESEENASDIERVEEQNIIASVESAKPASDDNWSGFMLDGVAVDDESPFFSEHFAVTEPNSEIDLTPQDVPGADSSMPSPSSVPTRRVRFAGVSSSSSSGIDSEVDEAAFPDLLFDQEHLHPSTRQLFEADDGEAQQLSDESYWEFDSREMLAPKTKDDQPQQESSDDFSGYESMSLLIMSA
jgi:hypothetical protein